MRIETSSGLALAKRMVYLAWQASAGIGLGFLQSRGPARTEEDIWSSAYRMTDYPSSARAMHQLKDAEVYCDYVEGRMMKLGIKWGEAHVELADRELRRDYQSWCGAYPTMGALAAAAEKSLAESSDAAR